MTHLTEGESADGGQHVLVEQDGHALAALAHHLYQALQEEGAVRRAPQLPGLPLEGPHDGEERRGGGRQESQSRLRGGLQQRTSLQGA